MDRIAVVLFFQWRAYWRRAQRAGNISTNNVGILILLGGIGVFKYLQQLPGVAVQLEQAGTTRYEMLLMAVFLFWLLPVMTESQRSISSRALLHFPLTSTELFLIRLGSIFISPVTSIIVICSLALIYPLAYAPNLAIGLAALALFLPLALAVSLIVADLLGNAYFRKLLIGAALVSSAALGVYWVVKGRVSTIGFALWPNKLAANAAVSSQPLRSLAALTGITVAAFCLSLWTFKFNLQSGQNRRSQRFTILGLIEFPGRFGGLLKKDLRDFGRLLDIYFALPIVVLFSIYLASSPVPSATAFRAILVILFLPASGIAFNCLGLETPLGLDRYTLLPLSGRDVLLSKNLAFALMIILLGSIIFPLALWRFGASVSALGFIELVLVGLAYLTWGNWMSVREPFRMQFYRLSSGGSPGDAIIGLIFGSLPGAITVYLLYQESYRELWMIVLMMLLYLVLYYLSITWSGHSLEQRREEIRSSLS